MREQSDEALLDAFVAVFEAFDDLIVVGSAGVPEPLPIDQPHALGFPHWRLLRASSQRDTLDALYLELPLWLPVLFEDLLLRWRSATLEVGV